MRSGSDIQCAWFAPNWWPTGRPPNKPGYAQNHDVDVQFSRGIGNDAFGLALEEMLAFLELHRSYLQVFRSEGGEIEVTLSQTIVWDDGVVFEMRLEPFFLQALVKAEATLRVTAWSADPVEPDL